MAAEGCGGRPWRTVSSRSLLLHLLLFVLLQLCHFSHSHAAYTLADFLAAYNNPAVSYHEVKGNIKLTASLPPLERSLTLVGMGSVTLVGKGSGKNNQVVIDGAAKYRGIVTSDNISLVNLEFRSFYTQEDGAVLSATGEQVVITNCIFRGNRASTGGAIDMYSTTYKIRGSQFIGNRAKSMGGALHSMSDGYGPIQNCVFDGNTAGASGGALSFRSDIGTDIKGCTFRKNKAGEEGGAIRFSRGLQKVSKNKFEGNVAGGFGGAIRFYGDDQGVLTYCKGNTFKNNKAKPATSSNIYIRTQDPENAYICLPLPPATLIDGNVTRSCRGC